MSETIQKKPFRFNSSDGTNTIAAYWYTDPVVAPRAIVQLSHGMCEYIARYDEFAAYLCTNGFAVCGNDHLGHGATSDGAQGMDGYFGDKDGGEYLLRDLHTMNALAKKEFPGLPVILLGHSMGSFFAREYAARWGDSIDALILSGTGGPNPLGGAGLALTSLLCKLKGTTHRSMLVQKMAFGAYLKRIEQPETPYDWITRDKKIVAAYAENPKCTFVFTVSAFHELMAILKKVNSPAWAKRLDPELPVLLLSGDMDPVGDYGKGVKIVYDSLHTAGLKHLALKLYPGARHEVLNETCRNEVYADVLDWMNQQLNVKVSE